MCIRDRFSVDANVKENAKLAGKPVASANFKKGTVTFSVKYKSSMLCQKFVAAYKKGKKYIAVSGAQSVSYTHLDVYKRQELGATGIVCDDELSPAQLKNLEQMLDTKVMDRTLIILDIFAARATTSEGKIQVELAQLKYRLSRLTGLGRSMSRLGGGIGTRGPGEKKLEMDRRLIKDRIAQLNRELKEVRKHREITRAQREKKQIPVAAIVGYTNAGKSTLLNHLTGAGVLEEDKLFATLDPTTRVLELPGRQEILLTDTVGFIRKLPHHLIEAFKSTLEEAKYADYILHLSLIHI